LNQEPNETRTTLIE